MSQICQNEVTLILLGNVMRYFREFSGRYPYRVRFSDLTMHLAEGISTDLLGQVHQLIWTREHVHRKSRLSGVLGRDDQRVFVKTSKLGSLLPVYG